MKSIGDLHGFLFIYEVSMVAMSKQVLKTLTRHGYFRGRLRTGLDISPCDIKDWGSGPRGFSCRGEESVREFLAGFSEADIARSARWSCLYAIYIKKGRFPEGEKAMQKSEVGWGLYNATMDKMDKARGREQEAERA
jgi:hypothetical protein